MNYGQYAFRVPPEKQVRVITDTDAKCEADDQFAIVHALLSPKFENIGFIGAHFGAKRPGGMEKSVQELEKIFDLMSFDPTGMIYPGACGPMPDEQTPIDSPGAQLIIREAMREDPRRLFVTFQGPLTDLASAYLLEPRIAGRLTAIWIGGGDYPNGRPEFNQNNDIHAVNVVMGAPIELWQVPKNVYEMMPVSFAELETKVRPCGKIGQYLFDQLTQDCAYWPSSLRSDFRTGETWVLGDQPVVGLILYEHRFCYDIITAPRIDAATGQYLYNGQGRPIRVYQSVDARLILEDFFAKLQLFAKNNPNV